MRTAVKIKIETPGDELYADLNGRLVRFNHDKADWTHDAFTVASYGQDGALIGGARGVVNMGLVEVRGLWIDPPYRNIGLGARLMMTLEGHARALGATRAALDTYDWQAREFYEKLGYTVFGALDYPGGAKRYYMRKDL
jgi:GNAT superfamily N-acetyltransferase